MICKIINRVNRTIEVIQFKVFSHILKKYNVEFYYKDSLGILTKRKYDDNFNYIFKTHNSCDAMPLMTSLNKKISNSKIGIDVGANIGITTMWMSKNCKKVYSFEPEKQNVERFKDNLSINNITNVELIQKAVSNRKGKAVLYVFGSYGHHSLSSEHLSKPKAAQEVDTITLDDFCSSNNIDEIDFLKIDIEGFELEALKGAKELLKNKKIKIIVFEHSRILFEKQKKDPKEVIIFLLRYNYKIYNLSGETIKLNNIEKLVQEDLYAI